MSSAARVSLDAPEVADRAIELGTFSYVIKPFTPNQVLLAARNALQRRKLELENRAHRETLEQIVRARTAALERSAQRLSFPAKRPSAACRAPSSIATRRPAATRSA